jgi:hypothetical protein
LNKVHYQEEEGEDEEGERDDDHNHDDEDRQGKNERNAPVQSAGRSFKLTSRSSGKWQEARPKARSATSCVEFSRGR